jgi:CHAD domain-containing protein
MARAAPSTRPVEVLNDSIRSLEAAALRCLASQKKKPVHQLRAWTRRIEAQLELIALLPGAPRAAKQRDKALRILKKFRRVAGFVRDLDVEQGILAAELRQIRGSSRQARAARAQGLKLRRHLHQQRQTKANALASLVKKNEKKLPRALLGLSDALKPAKKMAITKEKLVALAGDWYARRSPDRELQKSDLKTDALHALRKRAKLARYMVETTFSSGPAVIHAARLAARFEGLQHAGGRWHDLLQLHDAAAKQFGKSSMLVRRLSMRMDRALLAFKQELTQPAFR